MHKKNLKHVENINIYHKKVRQNYPTRGEFSKKGKRFSVKKFRKQLTLRTQYELH